MELAWMKLLLLCFSCSGGITDYNRWAGQELLSNGLCQYGTRVECCWGWRRASWGHCQPLCQQECKHGECVGPDKCKCHPGYTGKTCNQDLNECGLNPRPCKHRCMNTQGSYKCYCLNGYLLQPDGTCRNARTCARANCQYGCEVTKGVVRCQCPSPGLRLGPDRRTCVDVDECVGGRGVCPQNRKCQNTFGSYVCKCYHGYKLTYINGRYHCIDKDSRSFCSLNPASPKCLCREGKGTDCYPVAKVTIVPPQPKATPRSTTRPTPKQTTRQTTRQTTTVRPTTTATIATTTAATTAMAVTTSGPTTTTTTVTTTTVPTTVPTTTTATQPLTTTTTPTPTTPEPTTSTTTLTTSTTTRIPSTTTKTTRIPSTTTTTTRIPSTTTTVAKTTSVPITTTTTTTTIPPSTLSPTTPRPPPSTLSPTTSRPPPSTLSPTTPRPPPSTLSPTTPRPPPSTLSPTTPRLPPSTLSPTTPRPPPSTLSPTTPRLPPSTLSPTTPRPPPSTLSPTTPSPPPSTLSPTTPRLPPSTLSPTTLRPPPSTLSPPPSTLSPTTPRPPPSTLSQTTPSPPPTTLSPTTPSPPTTTTLDNHIQKVVTQRQRGDVHIPRLPGGGNHGFDYDIELGNTTGDNRDDPGAGALSCSFDHGLCGWIRNRDGDLHWETASSPAGGRYVSVPEVGAGKRSIQGARLVLPLAPPWSEGHLCFSFRHWLSGHHVGVLQLFVRRKGLRYSPALWSRTGGEGWRHTQITLWRAGLESVLLKGERRRGHKGEIGLDDVSLRRGVCREERL
ncbi:nephronectin-like [Salvelinus fontinalis]|uniref:nephronectin-like n=1 Tax=Salvelinus fontinalis TaxID=8038 RepID=UPI00248654B7|nr:nephronectin-like [Salvelinus fontinalis]